MNESHIHKVPQNNGRLFHMGKVSKLWRKIMVNNCQVFNLSDCAVVFKCNNGFGKINVTLSKYGFGLVCQCVKRDACGCAVWGTFLY